MRKLPVAALLSAALHGGAIAYVETRPRPKPEPPRPVTTVEIVTVAAPQPPQEPVAVALLDDHTVPSVSTTATAAPHATRSTGGPARGHAAISAGAGTATPGETPAGTTGHSPLMGMRGGEKRPLTWNPSEGFWTAFEANAKPADIPPPPSGELKPSGHGTYTSDHGMGGAFTAKVARDGTVTITDKPDVGDVHFSGLGIAGRASFDDWAMRKAGIDPYASAKRQWLDKTRDERARIGAAYRKDQLAHAPAFVRRNLADAWAKTEGDPAARKQALFELWDECAETGGDDMIAAGTAARAYIIGFIRSHLPQGVPGGFTGEDLSRFNAHKRSAATFQPY